MEASIQQVARMAGTTSRTLRHYDAVGLLHPSRVGHGGYRWYDQDALVRLQRILLLRDLGLGLPAIRHVLEDGQDEATALRRHLQQLRAEQARLARQVASVERTITAREGGAPLMPEEMFDGFDHTGHEQEVTERWGAEAYRAGDHWWRDLGEDGRTAWQARAGALAQDWIAAAQSGAAPDGDVAQALAARHVAWLATVPGTPGHGSAPVRDYVLGLADLYVDDPRFTSTYGGTAGATFVRDSLRVHVGRTL
ncbi:MerR family transcriptional regulator [Cellulomonas soli]|uniref:MerR family transcriptional regulator n=1 Tax=Cellulomonas soli TaxID=931535 RepID=A0A512PB84_9CELL|nr:MerR family transcriptional regulator [Cellulomonas soli]NYI61110.1 DNA-binding transcriptional MerR regulator [Cellulomonas soli]GEP68473.1 MerR family transcriptional regulator [Cellulomonas soli]